MRCRVGTLCACALRLPVRSRSASAHSSGYSSLAVASPDSEFLPEALFTAKYSPHPLVLVAVTEVSIPS